MKIVTTWQSLHSFLPLWDRQLLEVNSEASAERCKEGLNFAGLVDNSDPRKPRHRRKSDIFLRGVSGRRRAIGPLPWTSSRRQWRMVSDDVDR
jgi:hypothetical protein